MEPLVVPRDQHTLSRRDVDPDALKVLYRLKDAGFSAYLVGGGVRDLLLGRRPKDFDIGTDAHPYQIKKLFRNCWIIGRRFRLAHVVFGKKVIEVATFRRQVTDDEMAEAKAAAESGEARLPDDHQHLIHRDNTFGTAEEDAFRRDFTINALFYDIATFSIIDYVGGLQDLRARVVKCIGDPEVRFREDPVRMQRAISFGARLEFDVDQPILQAIARHRGEIAKAAPPRLMDEYYKILRTGCARRTFEALKRVGLFEPLSPVLHEQAGDTLWASLDRLDAYRRRVAACPDTLTNPVLLGSFIVPLGFSQAGWPSWLEAGDKPGLNLGLLPMARKDVERIHQVLILQRRLREPSRSPHARRTLVQRSAFADALTWLEIHSGLPDLLTSWRDEVGQPAPESTPRPRRRRRRRPRPR
ncbi:MAG: polynucleotide adenylyltransferase PcnB [Acidobacteria bacterium]|nr:polynucleotide adenylyltransferase PcnB [Acidobacteriota bacterium]